MTQRIKITYNHAGLQPPVYIAGSLDESQWQPVEMSVSHKQDGELEFFKEFDAEEGEYQYKFRLGPGDWWVLDENEQVVDDGAGNRNNMVVVKPVVAEKESMIETHVMDQATAPVQAPEQTEDASVRAPIPVPAMLRYEETKTDDTEHDPQTDSIPPVPVSSNEPEHVKQEVVAAHAEEDVTAPIQEPEKSSSAQDEEEEKLESSPLFSQESFTDKRQDSKRPSVSSNDDDEDEPQQLLPHESVWDEPQQRLPHESHQEQAPDSSAVEDFDDDEDFEEDEQPPLFRHESFAPHDVESAPLFQHESISNDDHQQLSSRSVRSNSSASLGSHRSRHVDSNDLNDPSLERFPTDQAGIMAHLQRTETRLREDEASFQGTPASPSMASLGSFEAETLRQVAPPAEMAPLSQVTSAQLDCITESEEPSSERPEKKTDVKEDAPIQPPARKQSPKLTISPSHEPVRGPLTPPMTPIDEPQADGSAHDGAAETFENIHLKTPDKARTRPDNATDNIASRSKTPSIDAMSISESKQANGVLSSFWDWFTGLCGGRLQAT